MAKQSNRTPNANMKDITGQKFNRLTVIGLSKTHKHEIMWDCVCDCGIRAATSSTKLKRGNTKSCGCLGRELSAIRFLKHGHRKRSGTSREYSIWKGMKSRCYDPNTVGHKHYIDKGIIVCDRWVNSFENFYEDMGPCPSKKHSIDREDNDGIYEKSNCRWATVDIQNRNQSSNVWLESDGRRMVAADWARELGITQAHLNDHLGRGRTMTDIIDFFKNKREKKCRTIQQY